MSAVFVHVGQCGNQLGSKLWEQLHSEHQTPYLLPSGKLPCVLVDTEHKVIHKVTDPKSSLFSDNIVIEKGSCANNWACGLNKGVMMTSLVIESIRQIAEECDCFMGTVLLHSIAGGTGSGLTCSIMEALRDEFPTQYLMTITVTPFTSGETPLQWYNSLLTLPRLQLNADCVVLFNNDVILNKCLKIGSNITMATVNSDISDAASNIFWPLQTTNSKRRTFCIEPWEMIRSLTPDKDYKFITTSHESLTKPTSTWQQLLHSVLPSKHHRYKLLSAILVCRSNPQSIQSLTATSRLIEKQFKDHYQPVFWNPFPIDFWFGEESKLRDRKYITSLTNSNSVVSFFKTVQERSSLMYESKAYLHWYNKYGVDSDEFDSNFHHLYSLIDTYTSLS